MTLRELNALAPSHADREFLRCCGSSRWAAAMTAARPFDSLGAMQIRAAAIWQSLDRQDWLEAFAAHPQIGDQGRASAWSATEQAGMHSADAAMKTRMARLNTEYESRFGYIFIVCATGKSSADMLSLLEERLMHDAVTELPIAAGEQRKITALRLAKLVEA